MVQRGDGVLFSKWYDSNLVSLMGWGISPEYAIVGRKGSTGVKMHVAAPQIAKEYNKYMGGVDQFDHDWMRHHIPFRSHSVWGRWWLPLWHFLIDLSVTHAYYFYAVHQHPNRAQLSLRPTGRYASQDLFILDLCTALLAHKPDRSSHAAAPTSVAEHVARTARTVHVQHFHASTTWEGVSTHQPCLMGATTALSVAARSAHTARPAHQSLFCAWDPLCVTSSTTHGVGRVLTLLSLPAHQAVTTAHTMAATTVQVSCPTCSAPAQHQGWMCC